MWLDGDDVAEETQTIPAILSGMDEHRLNTAMVRYDYNFDAAGNVVTRLFRERIIRRGCGIRWVNRIHEVLVPLDYGKSMQVSGLFVRHRRDGKPHRNHVAHRNLKVLLMQRANEIDAKHIDARTLFYLGNEARFVDPETAIRFYDEYCSLSGWDEERGIGRKSIGEIRELLGDYHRAHKEFATATFDSPGNPDPWFALARIAYYRNDWQRCIEYTDKGLAMGNPESVIMFNPLERTFKPHLYYNVALNSVGRVADALASVEAALKVMPGDTNLQLNRRVYAEHLGKSDAVELQMDEPLDAPPGAVPIPVLTMFAVQLWKHLMVHDELLKARTFLATLPWDMESVPQIAQLRAHMAAVLPKDEEALRQYYLAKETEPGPPWDTDPETWGDGPFHGNIPRWRFTMEHLPAPERDGVATTVLEVGCQDGWLANRLAARGFDVVGVDFSTGPLEIARRHGAETGAQFIEMPATEVGDVDGRLAGMTFDVVICNEVLEHVLNPVKLIRDLRARLRPGGTLILTTPLGSWLRGMQFDWAPKWNAMRDHLSAWTVASLRFQVEATGLAVDDCWSVPMARPDVPGQAMLGVAARAPAVDGTAGALFRRNAEALGLSRDIVIYTGPGVEWWSPKSIEGSGIGGSETAVIKMAAALRAQGHRVRCFIDCPNMEGIYGGVEYLHWGKVKGVACDVFIGSRQPAVMDEFPEARPGKVNYLWVHDIHCGNADQKMHERLLRFDFFLCLSEWHKQFFCDFYPFVPPERVIVTTNGIDLARYAGPKVKTGSRMIYSSAPDRGLELLLDLMPKIRERVPDAELHVYYGFETMESMARMANNQGVLDFAKRMRERLQSTPGVTWHGRQPQRVLAEAQKASKIWAYPTNFTETNCCHPDTRISVPGDHRGGPPTVRIADLVGQKGFPVYAFDEGANRFRIATATKVWETKVATEMVALDLDDGSVLRLTPEHPVLTFDGDWICAGDIQPGASLRALHYRYNVMIRDANGRWADEHRLVGEWMAGRELRRDEHVDHADEMRLDNRPEALAVMTASAHASKTHRGRVQSRVHEQRRVAAWHEWADGDGREGLVKRLRQNGQKLWDWVRGLPPAEREAWLKERARKKVDSERAGKNHRVLGVRRIPGGPVYDMEVDGLHNFVAEGVVIHNCITSMEVQAARCVPVTTRLAALAENVRCGSLLDGLNGTAEYQREFLARVCWLLNDNQSREMEADKGEAFAATRSWEAVAATWERMFDTALRAGLDVQPYYFRRAA
jgi:SAM-dependent methyltransferase